jgi:hypothetical protein
MFREHRAIAVFDDRSEIRSVGKLLRGITGESLSGRGACGGHPRGRGSGLGTREATKVSALESNL